MSTTSTKTVAEIVADIESYIAKCGGSYPSWYCGIASDPEDRLFNDHNVEKKKGSWIYQNAGTEAKARQVDKHFLNRGCQGGGGGGGPTTTFVYAYKITRTTREDN